MFKASMRGGRWKYGFKSIQDAETYARRILRRTGVFIAIEAYRPRKRKQ